MINALLMGILKIVISITEVILSPIDLAISNFLPNLSGYLDAFSNFLSLISQSIGWCISILGLSNEALSLIVTYYTFKLSAPMTLYLIKLALSWYDRLKP